MPAAGVLGPKPLSQALNDAEYVYSFLARVVSDVGFSISSGYEVFGTIVKPESLIELFQDLEKLGATQEDFWPADMVLSSGQKRGFNTWSFRMPNGETINITDDFRRIQRYSEEFAPVVDPVRSWWEIAGKRLTNDWLQLDQAGLEELQKHGLDPLEEKKEWEENNKKRREEQEERKRVYPKKGGVPPKVRFKTPYEFGDTKDELARHSYSKHEFIPSPFESRLRKQLALTEADIDIRELERRAALGDLEAKERLIRELVRVGRIPTAEEMVEILRQNVPETDWTIGGWYPEAPSPIDPDINYDSWAHSQLGMAETLIEKLAEQNYQLEIMSDEAGRSGVYYRGAIYQSPAGGYWYYALTAGEGEYYLNYGLADSEDLPEQYELIDWLMDYLV